MTALLLWMIFGFGVLALLSWMARLHRTKTAFQRAMGVASIAFIVVAAFQMYFGLPILPDGQPYPWSVLERFL